jgi:hypothetical protein
MDSTPRPSARFLRGHINLAINSVIRFACFPVGCSTIAHNMPNSTDILPPQLLNPFTPMAFLPPEQAYQTTIFQYVLVGMLSVRTVYVAVPAAFRLNIVFQVLVWDILTHLRADYKLTTRVNLPTVIYHLSRSADLS